MQLTKEEIRVLIIEKIAGSIGPADDLVIEELIKQDESVRNLWLSLSAEVRAAESNGFDLNPDEQLQWYQLEAQMKDAPRSKVRVIAKRILAAASVIAILGTGYWWLQQGSQSPANLAGRKENSTTRKVPTLTSADHHEIVLEAGGPKKLRYGHTDFETVGQSLRITASSGIAENWTLTIPAGSDYKIQLADGTEVWLNSASTISFPASFTTSLREVSMQGEAYFKVAKNPQKPFIVHTPETEVVVTGTQFNVNAYNNNRIQTSLVEGSVTLRNDNTPEVKLTPGYESEFIARQKFETRPFDSLEVLSWMKGIYYFRNTPLKELSELIKRWYDVDASFAGAALQSKTFSGELRKEQPLQSFLENLNLSGDVQAELKDGKLYFR